MILVLLVACTGNGTGGEDESTTSTESVSSTTTTASTPPVSVPPFEEVEVGLSEDGSFLVDGHGHALYLFTLDDDRTSSCFGECAGAWPPFLGDPVATEGVSPDLLGNAERGDGSIQVTYAGHPLYTYAEDAGPGDTNGHAFNDVWFLVGPDGTPLD